MNDPPIRTSFDVFRATRADAALSPEALQANAMLGIGVLIGGGFPGAAAAISVLVERALPGISDWPWGNDRIEPGDPPGEAPAFLKPRRVPRE